MRYLSFPIINYDAKHGTGGTKTDLHEKSRAYNIPVEGNTIHFHADQNVCKVCFEIVGDGVCIFTQW